jgi:hypothetical protein
MSYLLWGNTGFEALIGLLMLTSPKIFVRSADLQAADLSRSLAFALLTMATLSGAMALRNEPSIPGLIALAVFHGSFAVSQFLSFRRKFSPPPPMVIHAAFCVLFAVAARGGL